jgi:hypothetical protein
MPQHGLKIDETSLHPTFQENFAVGLNLKICHLNIECISASKSDYLSLLMRELREHEIDIVVIQETHTTSIFESSEQTQITRIQTDWCYPQQRSRLRLCSTDNILYF